MLIYLIFFNIILNNLLYIGPKIVLIYKVFYFFLVIVLCGRGIISFIKNSKIEAYRDIQFIFILKYIIILFLISVFINKKI